MNGVCRVDQLKRCLIVHSIIYYKLGDNIISDAQWDTWARELEGLLNAGQSTALHEELFKGWNSATGYHLVESTLIEPSIKAGYINKAQQLIYLRDKQQDL